MLALLLLLLYYTSKLAAASEQCDIPGISLVILSIQGSLVRRSMIGTHKLITGQDIIGLLILLAMYTVIWSNK